MRKHIVLKLNEKIEKQTIVRENGIYNGFGKIVYLQPIIEKVGVERNFDTIELGTLFHNLGNAIMQETKNITNISFTSVFENNLTERGKQLRILLEYDTVEEVKE